SDQAAALIYRYNDIDIYNNSWGPADLGSFMAPGLDAPGPLTLAALQDGVTNGRGGLGNIYTWAGGNGGLSEDNVNYDGYANSRFTIAVGAVNEYGVQSAYSEPGAPLLVVAPAAATTTDLTGEDGYNATGLGELTGPDSLPNINYTSNAGGTSAATPVVSGVVALMLEANPNLTWRDVQYILLQTARKTDPTDADWMINGAGYEVNHKYGFGVVDAEAAVATATDWLAVAPEVSIASAVQPVNLAIPNNNQSGVTSTITMPAGIGSLESVEVTFDCDHPSPGDLEVVLVSPSGTQSILAERHTDPANAQYNSWVFTSVRNWGEMAEGDWTLTVRDLSGLDSNVGTWNSWSLTAYGMVEPMAGLELITVIPNAEDRLEDGERLHVAPQELLLRFNEGQVVDPSTLDAIRLIRSGGDDSFNDGNEVVYGTGPGVNEQFGYIGIGERPHEVVIRFAETLPDDLYQLVISGSGATVLTNMAGVRFNQGSDQTIEFDLDLGAQVIAVVPQPVSRPDGQHLQQQRDQIEVYFNEDPLDLASAENPEFYQLIATQNTATTTDDGAFFTPIDVQYNVMKHKAILTFEKSLEELDLGGGAYRLRIGNKYQEVLTAAFAAPGDAGSSFDSADDLLQVPAFGQGGDAQSIVITGASIAPTPYDLQYILEWPGGVDEPGHREFPDLSPASIEDHFLGNGNVSDAMPGITTFAYNFNDDYGFDPSGNQLHNLITPTQKARARELMELLGNSMGVQFIEQTGPLAGGFTIATGDVRALAPDLQPGMVAGIAGGGVAIISASLDWGTSPYGGGWFQTAMHEFMHLMSFGHTYHMPNLTIMGAGADPAYFIGSSEAVFPGDNDIAHGQHMYRPDSNDIDLYKFELDADGLFSAETIAERMADSSLLDSVLTLYKEIEIEDPANPGVVVSVERQVIARNDDYYSEDSYLEMFLEKGTYYLGVSSTGNSQYDPIIENTGAGGTSQGLYDLRVNFTPETTQHMVDATGTLFDGDADGVPGGTYNFWFNAQTEQKTLFVDKVATGANPDGTLANPYSAIDDAFAAAQPGDIVRVVGNWDTTTFKNAINSSNNEEEPRSVALGDVNGDGLLDAVTANVGSDTLSVMLGRGDGRFVAAAPIFVGQKPYEILLEDIDGNRILDIVTINSNDDTLAVFMGVGDGTFGAEMLYDVGDRPLGVALGDIDGDGTLDLVTADSDDNTVSVLLSNGDGTFATAVPYPVGQAPNGVALGDFDGDEILDIVTANRDDNTVSVLLGVGDGTMLGQLTFAVGAAPVSVAVADFNGDLIPEIVAANQDGDNVSVLLGIGDGTFGFEAVYDVGDGPQTIVVGDLNADGYMDIVTANAYSDTVSVLLGIGGGTFLTEEIYAVADEPMSVALGDLDGDGMTDIVTANSKSDGVSALLRIRDLPYQIGYDLFGNPLPDGAKMEVPRGVTLMIDEGAVFKFRDANLDVGSSSVGLNRSLGAVQVLGTPEHSVYFTSYHNEAIGVDGEPARPTTPQQGDWGGIVMRNDLDRDEGRVLLEDEGIFLNYINHANISYGGGEVMVDSIRDVYSPIHMMEARATVSFNTITNSADAAMSADPNSFEDTKFQDHVATVYTADYDRVGPDIHGNHLIDNTINGIFVRVRTDAGKPMDKLEVAARFDDTDIVHVVAENLLIAGTPGGPLYDSSISGLLQARLDARLAIDPGIVVKLGGTRIETEVGAQLIAEGIDGYPVIFTSMLDARYGAGGTFETSEDLLGTGPAAGDWGGLYFAAVSSGSIDRALIAHAGGNVAIEGDFAAFNPIEIHQASVRISNTELADNAEGGAGSRNGRGSTSPSTIFVRGAQPVIVNNIIRRNEGPVISIDVNALNSVVMTDPGRSTGAVDAINRYSNNTGPLVRGNRLDDNRINGMRVRGGTMTTEGVWDDTDIVHVLFDEIVVPNLHTYGGLRLQSSASESLVVKLNGANAGFTASGSPQDIDDRIGGTLQIIGAPGHPVVLTALADDTLGAGLDPWGMPQFDTDNANSVPTPGSWRSIKLEKYSNDRNVAVVTETEKAYESGTDVNGNPRNAQYIGDLATKEQGGDDNLRLGFEVLGNIRLDDPGDIDIYSFKAQAGTEVWFDIDRTDNSLDTVIELVDSDGNVLARSDNAYDEQAGTAAPLGLGMTMDRDIWLTKDVYTTNRRDAGMRVVLPGAVRPKRTYYVKVYSAGGLTKGAYELQVRMRQEQEFAGSTIRLGSIHYATNGIELLGLPTHSPLTTDFAELATDNDTFNSAQYVGNLLDSDRNSILVGGSLETAGDVDWYRFALDLTKIQSIAGVNDSGGTFPVMFDIDYADGMERPDTYIWVFNAAGQLILSSRDSNIADDRPRPGDGTGLDDLSRGTVGAFDPFIGNVQMPEGNGVEYFVAVTAEDKMPEALFSQPLLRREPITSVLRIADDHIGAWDLSYIGGDLQPTTPLFGGGGLDLNLNADEFHLGDVVM
ncbi:MAG TPA: FG-GAP-like repeat-containing protein, partial [Thermoguttaceae bacterium]|nr:FG-GAP-like repeat-containing protein [Thermoguttaceae bacterium]